MTPSWVKTLRGLLPSDALLTAPGDRYLYAYDAALEKHLPAAVVLPRTTDEVAAVVRFAHTHKIPYAPRGAGTNLCGGSVPADGGLVIHLARMNKILSVDENRRRAWVEPGVVNLHLQKALAPRGFFYAPDPASQKACTLGGNVGTNAGGPHCLKHGVTSTHVTGLTVVLPPGEVASFSVDTPGYDLTGFWVGAEGTLGVVTAIEVNLLPIPEAIETFLVAFPSMEAAAQTVTDIVASGVVPTTLEVMDRLTVQAVEAFMSAGYPTAAEAVLLIEIDGPAVDLGPQGRAIEDLCRRNGGTDFRRARDAREREKLWEGRRGAYPAMARLAPNVLVEDGVVPRTRLPEAVQRLRAIARRDNLRLGLIAHAGDGNLHPNMIFDERDPEETRRVKAAGEEMLRVCVELGGSISGEHGIGTDKRNAMTWLFPPETLSFFRQMKVTLDPDLLANPGKILPDPPFHTPTPSPAGALAPVERPGDVAAVQGLLAEASRSGRPVHLRGRGTAGRTARPGACVVDLAGLDKILELDRDNLTLTVQAGASLDDVRRVLSAQGRYLHLRGTGSVGGALAAPLAGEPRVRDQILGATVVLPGGLRAVFGGKVVKNVAGYDAAKLWIGSWGTLGVLVEVTLRLHVSPGPDAPLPARRPPDFSTLPTAALQRRIQRAVDPAGILRQGLWGEDISRD